MAPGNVKSAQTSSREWQACLLILALMVLKKHTFILAQKHIMEAPFLSFWDFYYLHLQRPRPTLEWSPIQVLTVAQDA